MNFSKYLLSFSLVLSVISPIIAMESAQKSFDADAAVFDADDVLAAKGNVKTAVAGAVLWQNPFLINTLAQLKGAMKEADALGINGTANTVAYASKKLENAGTGSWAAYVGPTLSQITKEFVDASVDPQAMQDMFQEVQKLKSQGVPVFIATNQDLGQYRVWARKMKAQGYNVDALFDGKLVVGLLSDEALNRLIEGGAQLDQLKNQKPESVVAEDENFWVTSDNVYVTKNPIAVKPHSRYYDALKGMVKRVKRNADKITFIDDKKENAEAAKQAGLIAVQLELAGEAANKTSPDDIKKAIIILKKRFADQGVQFDN